jgi:hypothetical protein
MLWILTFVQLRSLILPSHRLTFIRSRDHHLPCSSHYFRYTKYIANLYWFIQTGCSRPDGMSGV